MVIGRIDSADVFRDHQARLPSGYTFRVHGNGVWELLSTGYGELTRTLAQGQTAPAGEEWHHLQLAFAGKKITAALDGKILAAVEDSRHAHGMFGIGSAWSRTQFDSLAVTGNR
jgi:hypothetical protein